MIDNFGRCNFSNNLFSFYEGKTISYFVEKPNDNDLLYFGTNEELNMITDPKKYGHLSPFLKILMEVLIQLFIHQMVMKEI